MPRTKLDKPDSSKKLVALIAGAAKAEQKTCIDMADILGCSPNTISNRLREPDNFTYGELKKLGRGLHIPLKELRQSITY